MPSSQTAAVLILLYMICFFIYIHVKIMLRVYSISPPFLRLFFSKRHSRAGEGLGVGFYILSVVYPSHAPCHSFCGMVAAGAWSQRSSHW